MISNRDFWTCLGLLTVIGAAFRLYMFGIQVILDDGWHTIYIVAEHSYSYIFTNFTKTGTCIPMYLFYKLLMDTVGLNEWLLRLPQIFTGCAALILFPVMAKKYFQERVSLIFAGLLAISPLFVFYSRFTRPYCIVVFLVFISLFSFYRLSR